ncbi:S41 family peptidase [Erythrobacter sp. T5W1-R]|uniref:S41 family peptidase n=1 Tax=Erythrobacter sp. T5W1-R TaxID=3101752 RepID=UPI002AFEDF50|nr:S41 family peptidase [Erythrobacter sp. T5W1-R]MEA1618006.1 S41 family peptidase [Erythrobacter sp. T5W1-R]
MKHLALAAAILALPLYFPCGIIAPLAAQNADPARYTPQLLSAEQASRDVALLRRALETVHPGLYRYSDKPAIDAAFARLEAAATAPINELAFHAEIARLLAAIHCDHTKAEMSEALDDFRNKNPTHLPLRFQLIEGRMIVVSNDRQAGAPPVGSEILGINGMPVPSLLLQLAPLVSYDGATDQAIAAKLADDSDLMGDDFNENYPALFGFPDRWQIEWKPVGGTRATTATLQPIRFAQWTALAGPGAKYRSEFYNAVTWRISGTTARLGIDTFVNYRNPVQATAFLGGFFAAIQEAGTDHLILDLRKNGGGSEDVSVALGRYLIDRPFIWAKPTRLKAVRYGDLQQYFETWGDREARFNAPLDAFTKTADGWYDLIPVLSGETVGDGDSAFEQQPIDDLGFRGRLTILSGPRNGSGATRTIAQLKEKAGAVIVGEESAGSAEGPTSGSIFLMKLPESGIKVRIPEAWNRTNIARFVPGKGVPVDQLVMPTLADFEAGRDRTIEVAQGLLAAPTDTAAAVSKALAGDWAGTLDYRDFSDDSRETLTTLMRSDGAVLSWTFDDGPGKTMRSSDTWVFDAAGQALTITAGKNAPDQWRVLESRISADGESLTIVLEGESRENGRSVTVRKILTRDGSRLRITKQTRVAGEPFLMRQSYELRRQGFAACSDLPESTHDES